MKPLSILIAFVITFLSYSQNDTTTVAITMNSELYGGGNVVYCSSVEFLWRELSEYLGETPIPEELHLEINELNQVVSTNEIPLEPDFWFAHVGTIREGIIDSISKSYREQFGSAWNPPKYDATHLIGHSYLKKNVSFYSRLDDEFHYFKFTDSIRVKCFGLDGDWANPTYKKQLKIHDYINEDNFIFQMGCKDTLDEIFFAKVPSEGNLSETYNSIMNRVNQNNIRYIGEFDQLQIPYLKFDIKFRGMALPTDTSFRNGNSSSCAQRN